MNLPKILPHFAVFICAAGNCFSQELRHYWNFQGAFPWADKAGTAHGQVPLNTTILTTTGADGSEDTAVEFQTSISGDTDYFAIDGTQLYQPEAESFSFTYWFRIQDDLDTIPRGIFDFSGNGGDGAQSLFIGASNELAFRIDTAGPANALVKIPMTEDGLWHFVAATYDPVGGLTVHLDGFGADGTAAATGGDVLFDSVPYLGAFNFDINIGAANKGLTGDLDDFAIYSGVLSQTQIEGLYDRTISPVSFLPASDEAFRISRIERSGNEVTVYWHSAPGAFYSVWRSSSLSVWQGQIDDLEGTGEEMSYTETITDPVMFYRIQDDTPPLPQPD